MSPIQFPKHLPRSNIVQIFTEELPFIVCTGEKKVNLEKFCNASQAVFFQECDVIMKTSEKMPSVQIFKCIDKGSGKICDSSASTDTKGWL